LFYDFISVVSANINMFCDKQYIGQHIAQWFSFWAKFVL